MTFKFSVNINLESGRQEVEEGILVSHVPKQRIPSIPSNWFLTSGTVVIAFLIMSPSTSSFLKASVPAVWLQQTLKTFQVESKVGQKIAKIALSWKGKDYKPGQTERCADFVRHVLRQGNISVGVTQKPIDVQENNGELMARSFFGSDIGRIITNSQEIQPGDLLGFYGTYGRERWGDKAITHVGIAVDKQWMVHRPTVNRPVQYQLISGMSKYRLVVVRPYAYGN